MLALKIVGKEILDVSRVFTYLGVMRLEVVFGSLYAFVCKLFIIG